MLTLPMFQQVTGVFNTSGLDGDFTLNECPEWSWESWMDGSYQPAFDRFIEDHIGFRNFFVRLNNQIEFSFFNKTNTDGVIIGKNNILYEYDYIRALIGDDFMGEQIITNNLNEIKFLQEYLKSKFNISFILIFEPSKARTYPEYIPDRYLKNIPSVSNYEYYIQKADELDIEYLDLNKLFLLVRDTSTHPVYPHYGIHWSEHTMSFITDTLIKYIENLRGINIPEFEVETRFLNNGISKFDYDAGRSLNLMFRLSQPQMPYPIFTFNSEATGHKPMVLAIADSYYWNIFNTRVPRNLFANEAFWYFSTKVYPDFYYKETWAKDLDLNEEIEKQDVIILGVTERFLYKFGWDFVRQVYKLYSPEYTGDVIEKYEKKIVSDLHWVNNLIEKSKKEETPLNKSIEKLAKNLAFTYEPETYLTWYGTEHFISLIQSDTIWNESIILKAAKTGQSYDEQLVVDAKWSFNEQHPEIFKKHQLIKKIEQIIKSDSIWLCDLKQKTDTLFLPLDLMIKIEAEKLAEQGLVIKTTFEKRVSHYEKLIWNTPEWLQKVTDKANKNRVPIYKMIRADAIYMAKQEKKKNDEQ